jgi:3-deoxy-7-phosphoheptulonate synthase
MQPDPCGTPNVKEGVRSVRQLFSMLTDARGIPLHDEALNIALAPYVNEWLSFTTIGARTSESQPHREHAASRDMPVGLKNSSDGELRTIIDAMTAVQTPQACIVENTWGMAWNHDAMGILRGGRHGSNFDEPSLRQLIADLARVRITFEDRSIPLPSQALGIDCAHGNSKVNGSASPAQQLVVGDAIVGLMEIDPSLQQNVRSLMYEVHLREGKQPIGPSMEHGVSTTDPCVGIDCFREHILPLADRYRRVMRPGA